MDKKPVFVVVLHGDLYKRFVGKTMTHHVKADRTLNAAEVETFRVTPEALFAPEAA